MEGWDLPWEGGCRCGAVRVRATKPPLLTGVCHCTGCRRMSGSAFALTVSLPGDGFEVIRGEPAIGGLGGPVSHHYHCSRCKSWMFTRAEGMDWFVNLRASVLDDDRWVVPYVELWTSEKLPWATVPARRSYATVPAMDEFGALIEAFAAEGTRPRAG